MPDLLRSEVSTGRIHKQGRGPRPVRDQLRDNRLVRPRTLTDDQVPCRQVNAAIGPDQHLADLPL